MSVVCRADEFLRSHMEDRAQAAAASDKMGGGLEIAYRFAFGAVLSYRMRIKEAGAGSEESSHAALLAVDHVTALAPLTRTVIRDGLYPAAELLVSAAFEAVVALRHAPSPGPPDSGFGRSTDLARAIEMAGAFDGEEFVSLSGSHALLLIMLFGAMRRIFREPYGVDWQDEEVAVVTEAVTILREAGVMPTNPTLAEVQPSRSRALNLNLNEKMELRTCDIRRRRIGSPRRWPSS